jgi:Zn-dependent peptidase ImmA (M78 family)
MLVDMSKVAWLSKAQIEQQACSLLEEFSSTAGRKVTPPIPVEAMIELHFGITLEYDDLEESLEMPGVLGATWVNEKKMVINSSLLDGVEGRLVFTCGHEIGHWVLHRSYFFEQFSRLGTSAGNGMPAIICRTSQSKLRGEWQADYFSGALLIPETEAKDAYTKAFGREPLVLYNEKSCFGRHSPIAFDPALDTVKEIAQKVIEQGGFTNVSKEAMVYRLHELGLLINATGKKLINPSVSTALCTPSPGR